MTPCGLNFPWPRSGEAHLEVALMAHDPIWMAAVRQQVTRCRSSLQRPLPLVHVEKVSQLPPNSIRIVEVAGDRLSAIGDWLVATRNRHWPVVALLERSTCAPSSDRAAAMKLLYEAGAGIVLANVDTAGELLTLLSETARRAELQSTDPLDDLPLRCWDPAWQRRQRRLG